MIHSLLIIFALNGQKCRVDHLLLYPKVEPAPMRAACAVPVATNGTYHFAYGLAEWENTCMLDIMQGRCDEEEVALTYIENTPKLDHAKRKKAERYCLYRYGAEGCTTVSKSIPSQIEKRQCCRIG